MNFPMSEKTNHPSNQSVSEHVVLKLIDPFVDKAEMLQQITSSLHGVFGKN